MKNSILIGLLFLLTNSAQAQLLNGSFEDLYINDLGVQEAEHWQSNNDSMGWWVYYDSIAYHLEHPALLLGYQANSGWTGCQSILRQEIADPQLQEGDVLSFYSYSHPTPSMGGEQPYFYADLLYYKNGLYIGKDSYEEQNYSNSYSYKEVAVTIFDADSLVVFFTSGAEPGPADGCHHHTNTYVDKVELGAPLSNEVTDHPGLKIYANAAFGYVTIKGELETVDRFAIFDMAGQLVTRGSSLDSSIRLPGAGMFVLQVITEAGQMQSLKFTNF